MATKALTTLFFAVLATSLPAPSGHEFRAPRHGDVRSPCPGLNALANHGFIPRDGKNNRLEGLIKGGKDGMNMGADFMGGIGAVGIGSNPNPALGYFDLNHLDEHDFPIEHDGSLSRQDKYFGNWYDLKRKAYHQWISQFGDAKTTTIKSASEAKYTRVNDSLTRNPNVAYGPREFILSYGETALYLQTMGMSTTSGEARLDYIREFFVNETLPYDLGWQPGSDEVTLFTLGNMIFQLFGANDEALPEGLEVLTQGTVTDVFNGIDPVTGKLVNITSGIL